MGTPILRCCCFLNLQQEHESKTMFMMCWRSAFVIFAPSIHAMKVELSGSSWQWYEPKRHVPQLQRLGPHRAYSKHEMAPPASWDLKIQPKIDLVRNPPFEDTQSQGRHRKKTISNLGDDVISALTLTISNCRKPCSLKEIGWKNN
jgi:hypothetical protein